MLRATLRSFATKTDFIAGGNIKVSPTTWYYFLNYNIKPT